MARWPRSGARIDFTKLVPGVDFVGEDAEDDALVQEMIERARSYATP